MLFIRMTLKQGNSDHLISDLVGRGSSLVLGLFQYRLHRVPPEREVDECERNAFIFLTLLINGGISCKGSKMTNSVSYS